jgi:hypothetical protein
MIIGGTPSIIVLAVTREAFVATIGAFVKGGRSILMARRRESAVSNHAARLVPFILRDDRFAASSG